MNKLENLTSHKKTSFAIKVFFVLLATGLATIVFGLCIPFALIAFSVLPHLGLAGIIYLIVGGAAGFLFGSISASMSLFKSEKIITAYYIKLMICLAVISLLYLISYMIFPEAYNHI